MKFYPKKILKTAFIALFALCLGLSCLAFTLSPRGAKADGENYQRFIPATPLENTELLNPTHAYADGEITAITTTDNKLLISYNSQKPTVIPFTNSLGQVLRFGNYVLCRVEHNMYAVNFSNTEERISLTYTDGLYNSPLACDNCSYNNNESGMSFAVCVEETLKIYNITEDAENKPAVSLLPYFSENIIPIKKAPVAINSTSVFYITQSGILCKREIGALGGEPTQYKTINPSAMIADEDYVYCVSDNQIYRFTIADETLDPVIMSIPDCDYQLGKPSVIADIAFKNGNILITDNAGSLQEFEINGDALEFTGYAVASGLTAYNRISANATDIERYGNYVAALDENKLTIINTENCAGYDKNGFINKFVGISPEKFSLGNGTIAYLQDGTIYLSPVKDGEPTAVMTDNPATALNDIAYQSGAYYFAYVIGTNTTVIKIDETTGEQIGNGTEFTGIAAKTVAADVFGNIYVSNDTNIYVNDADNGLPFSGTEKLATDLAGNLFVLSSDGKIYKYNETAGDFSVAFETAIGNIKSFGLNFDKNQVFFLIEGQEQVYTTTAINNVSLQDVVPDTDFNSATQSVQELKVYTAKSGANVYSVSAAETSFTFNGLIQTAAEYPFMSKFILSDNLTLYALASESGVVLINENDLTEKAVEFTNYAVPEKAYITTAVNAYAIPVIEKNDLFAIRAASDIIRLNKGTEITAAREFNILGKTFYQVAVNTDGETIECYIPKSFTLKTLSSDITFNEYSVEIVKSTVLYLSADMTEEIIKLDSGDSVRVLAEENGVLKVETIKNGETFTGYITKSAIKLKPDTVVRNVLIVLAVFGSLAGTLTFFLLRKRK